MPRDFRPAFFSINQLTVHGILIHSLKVKNLVTDVTEHSNSIFDNLLSKFPTLPAFAAESFSKIIFAVNYGRTVDRGE